LDKFDWFVKKNLRIKYYFRYADDFVVVCSNPDFLRELVTPIKSFLTIKLDLELHPQKIQIRKFRQGVDFLGYVVLPHYIVLRTMTKKRMFKKIGAAGERLELGNINGESFNQSLQSYYGMLKHCDGYRLRLGIDEYIRDFFAH